MPFAVNHSYHGKTLYMALTLIALYDNGQSYHVLHLHSPGQFKIYRTQTLAQWAMTANTAFITQTVLCKAPYRLPSLNLLHHAQHKKAYLLHTTLLQWSKELAKILCVGHVHINFATHAILNYVICR